MLERIRFRAQPPGEKTLEELAAEMDKAEKEADRSKTGRPPTNGSTMPEPKKSKEKLY